MIKMICWDMDGTIADFYSVQNWLEKVRSEDESPYLDAKPLWNMELLKSALEKLSSEMGIEIRIITWLSKNSSENFKSKTRKAKLDWLSKYEFPFDSFHGIQYGRTKADSVRHKLKHNEEAVLIDDNKKVRQGWHLGPTIDPQETDIVEWLYSLIERGHNNENYA